MRNKNKGFTLVELLAVIVILAVLVLLAVPSVINMMSNAKKNAFSTEANNIIKATTMAYADDVMNGTPRTCYSLEDLSDYLDKNLTGYSGSVEVDIDNNTYKIWLSNGSYMIDGSYRGNINIIENEGVARDTCESLLVYKEAILNGAYPRLDEGMIPVVISNAGVTTTVNPVSDTWYSYTNNIWANAVLVKESGIHTREYYKTNPNVTVDAGDILAYFVWIPRYSYTIKSEDGTNYYGKGGTSADSPGAIDIKFVNRSTPIEEGSATYTGATASNYRTHPAFTFGEQKLNGIWVGKYETTPTAGTTCATTPETAAQYEENCKNENPTILPNMSPLLYQNVSTAFLTALKFGGGSYSNGVYTYSGTNPYGLTVGSHMMKDTEWGAVSYLTQSQYGVYPSAGIVSYNIEVDEKEILTYLGNEVRINNNSSRLTGYAAVTAPTTGYSLTSVNTNQHGTDSSVTKPWTDQTYEFLVGSPAGYATTTHNMSGICDGGWGYVMAVYNNYSGMCNYYNSGFNGVYGNPSGTANCDATLLNKSDGVNFPNGKYYTTYTTATWTTACDDGICYGSALSETAGWNNPYNEEFVSVTYPWSLRNGDFSYADSSACSGYADDGYYSFRVVIGL